MFEKVTTPDGGTKFVPRLRSEAALADKRGSDFVVISRNFRQWEAYNRDQKLEDFTSPAQLKSLQNFQPKYTPEQLQYFAAMSPGNLADSYRSLTSSGRNVIERKNICVFWYFTVFKGIDE